MSTPAAFAAVDPRGRLHLVLDGTAGPLAVSLDGLALRIAQPPNADTLAPVRRIDRVTCRGAVAWESAALIALAQVGAPVGLVIGGGRLAAVLVPATGVPGRLAFAAALDRVTDRLDIDGRLEDWRRSQLSRLARRHGATDPAAVAREGWPSAEIAVASHAPPPAIRARYIAREARTFVTLLARRALYDAGCPPSWMGADGGHGRDLVPIIAQIGLWRLAVRLKGPAGQRLVQTADADRRNGCHVGGRMLAAMAELARPRLRRELSDDVERLRSFLLDIARTPDAGISRSAWRG